MKKLVIILGLFLISHAVASAGELDCKVGPAEKRFGGVPWNVYACNDERSVILVSTPGSSAHPFYFALLYTEGAYRLTGEGTGNKDVTASAYKELESLEEKRIHALWEEVVMINKKLQPAANVPAE